MQNQDGFVNWLVVNGISKRVAGNYASRCKRVEYNLGVDLCVEIVTEQRFIELMISIKRYSASVSKNKLSEYNLSGSLRLAVRKFAQYKIGNEALEYPACHRLNRASD